MNKTFSLHLDLLQWLFRMRRYDADENVVKLKMFKKVK